MAGPLAQVSPESATSHPKAVSWCRFPTSTVAGPQGLEPLSLRMNNLSYVLDLALVKATCG